MRFRKGWYIAKVELRKSGKAFYGLAGYDGYLFFDLPKVLRIISINSQRGEIAITDEETFNKIKESKVLHKNLFPYEKRFSDLEELQ